MRKKSYLGKAPKLKVKDKVFDLDSKKIGVILRIDNLCSKYHSNDYENPGYLEYYVKWHDSWTRHDVHEIDDMTHPRVVPYTKTIQILYGKNKK
jgi:hypothetical protein